MPYRYQLSPTISPTQTYKKLHFWLHHFPFLDFHHFLSVCFFDSIEEVPPIRKYFDICFPGNFAVRFSRWKQLFWFCWKNWLILIFLIGRLRVTRCSESSPWKPILEMSVKCCGKPQMFFVLSFWYSLTKGLQKLSIIATVFFSGSYVIVVGSIIRKHQRTCDTLTANTNTYSL